MAIPPKRAPLSDETADQIAPNWLGAATPEPIQRDHTMTESSCLRTARCNGPTALLLALGLVLASCGGGGGGGGGGADVPARGITPRVEVLDAVSVDAREGLFSDWQTLFVSNAGVVGEYSWDVVFSGAVSATASLVAGGVELRFRVQGGVGAVSPTVLHDLEVWFCSAAPCTPTNSLRRIVPVRVNVVRGLTWHLPPQLFYGGLGLGVATEAPQFTVGLPNEPGTLAVEVIPIPGWPTPPTWLQAAVEPGAADTSRVVRLSAADAATLALGEYGARLRARYTFADGSAPLELLSDFLLQVRRPGCRLPESSPSSPQTYGIRGGPGYAGELLTLRIPVECWGITADQAAFQTDAPWLRTSTSQNAGRIEVAIALDAAAAKDLPSQVEAALQLRITSAVQDEALIPFTMGISFADVYSVTPSTIAAGVPAEVLLAGAHLGSDAPPLLYDSAGQPVPGVTLRAVRVQNCRDTGGCDLVVALPPLPMGEWTIGLEQPPGVQRPRGTLRVTAP